MTKLSAQSVLMPTLLIGLLLSSTTAEAFRCGRKLVKEDMHEIQVRKICGKPAIERQLGFVLRNAEIPIRRTVLPGVTVEQFPGYGIYTQEVALTEYVYNFGPRKLMRRLLFEGGVLKSIETIGYGYREEK